MRNRAVIAFLCLTALVAGLSTAGAHELGARAFGMGGAYVALSDDIAALVYNPAGLPNSSFEVGLGLGSNDLTAITQFQSLLSDPSSFSGDVTIDVATLSGVSIGSYGAGIAANGSLSVSDVCGGPDLCADGEYMTQLIFGYGRNTAGLPFHLAGLQAGFSVKRLDGRRIDFEKSAPAGGEYTMTTDDWRGQGLSLGLGAQLKASDIFTLGFAANDLFSSVTWKGTRTVSTYRDIDDVLENKTSTGLAETRDALPRVYRLGIAVEPPLLGLTLAADSGSDGSIRYGIEKDVLLGALSLRFGGIRASGKAITTGGIGVHLGPFRLDAAVGSADGFQTVTTMIEGSVRF